MLRAYTAYLAVDELDVVRALGVAIASPVLGTSLVRREPAGATVLVHLDEVERTVETAGEARHVDVEGELLVLQVECLVGAVILGEEVDTRTNVRRVRALGHELETEGIAARRDTVGTLKSTSKRGRSKRRSGVY